MSTNNKYKLPTDIESRFNRDIYMPHESSCDSEVHLVAECNCDKKSEYGVKQFIATEQVTLLEWMLGLTEFQIKVDENGKKWIDAEYLKSKIQAKLEEYKV